VNSTNPSASQIGFHVNALRSFGRSYTKQAGLLDETPYDPSLTLMESRIVFELAQGTPLRAKDLCDRFALDKGYVSRVLAGLRKRGILDHARGTNDARERILSLTSAGKRAFAKIDRVSKLRMEKLLAPLGTAGAGELVRHLTAAQLALDPEQKLSLSEIKLRGLVPGDIGWVVERHGKIYFDEFGWDQDFEILVSEIATAFAKSHDPAREHAWIAEARGVRLGCIFLVRETDQVAKLRILLVDPLARGIGLGSLLVRTCVDFAKKARYREIVLWTNSVLLSARRIYEDEGFSLVREEPHRSFGKKLLGQYWSKALKA
jgi:DNA-binding MarR family transcriptional regulator/GNAT superfamily N-acetyltransferase